jgi:SAM-dependent methyltransferase
MTRDSSTEAIYDVHATRWSRKEPILLSDFTARPFVIRELGPLEGTHVLDLGCGEGYVARLAAEAGAASVFGVDISAEMVKSARLAMRPILAARSSSTPATRSIWRVVRGLASTASWRSSSSTI